MESAFLYIPKSHRSQIVGILFIAVTASFTILAIVDMALGIARIAPCIWLILLALILASSIRGEGGLRQWLVGLLALAGKDFACCAPRADGPELLVGFDLLGRRFIRWSVPLSRIESVEWYAGQATALAQRDMNDWHVVLRLARDPAKRESAAQRIRIVGPARPKELTKDFGLSFIRLLSSAGVRLVEADKPELFIREAEAMPNA